MYKMQIEVGDEILDKTYRHVSHTDSLKLLEKCRLNLLTEIGLSSESLIADDLFPVVTAVRAEYLREVLEGAVTVTCESCVRNRKGFVMKQRIINAKDKTAVTAEVDWLIMQGASKRAVEPPQKLLAGLSKIFLES